VEHVLAHLRTVPARLGCDYSCWMLLCHGGALWPPQLPWSLVHLGLLLRHPLAQLRCTLTFVGDGKRVCAASPASTYVMAVLYGLLNCPGAWSTWAFCCGILWRSCGALLLLWVMEKDCALLHQLQPLGTESLLSTYIYMNTYMHTYIHTHIPTYIYIYIHTHI